VPQPEVPEKPYSTPVANEEKLIEFLMNWTADIADERLAHKKKRALARKRKAEALLRAVGGGVDRSSEGVLTSDKNSAVNQLESNEPEDLGACGEYDDILSAPGYPCKNGKSWAANLLEAIRSGEYGSEFVEEELNSEELDTENDDATSSTTDSYLDEETYINTLMEVGIDEETAKGIFESCKRGGKLTDNEDRDEDEEEEDQDPVEAEAEFDKDFGSTYSPPTRSDSRGSSLSS